jgi:uncharacterized protein
MVRFVARVVSFFVALPVLFAVASAEAAASPIGPPAYVVDGAHVLRPKAVQQISGELAAFELRTAHQLAVVTVPDLGGRDEQAYARELFNRWGIGRAGVNDGGLLLVAIEERKVRIQVGQGLRNAGLTDDAAVRIVDDITPVLHRDDFSAGLVAGERAMRKAVGDTALVVRNDKVARFGGGQAIAADSGHESTEPALVVGLFAVFGSLVAGVFYVAVRGMRRGRRPGRRSTGGAGWTGGWFGDAGGGGSFDGGGGGGGGDGGGGGASGGF